MTIFTLENPDASATYVIGVTVTRPALDSLTGCTGTGVTVSAGGPSPTTCTGTAITSAVGAAFDFVIYLANGLSISGSVVAQ